MSSQPSPSAYDDARIAHFEREENFRWISSFLATTSSVTLNERVPEAIEQAINAFGELSEIAHGSVDPSWIFILENRKTLGRRGFPLEQYPTLTREVEGQLEDLELVERFHGTRGSLQGYCCLRMKPRTPAYDTSGESSCARPFRPQIVLSFSGTSNARLAMYDIMAASVAYKTAFNHPSKSSWRAHDGFQRVYHGVKAQAFKSLRNAMFTISSRSSEPWDLVITAHSLGAAVSYLALLDLLHRNTDGDILESDVPILPLSTNITICVFGSPRVANTFLVGHYRELIKEWREKRGRSAALTEWSIIGHRDGVPTLPPTALGYSHLCSHPYYSYCGHLYIIPPSESEHGHFNVDAQPDCTITHPRGGHNYYGARDMERLQRRMKGIALDLAETACRNPPKRRKRQARPKTMSGDTLPHRSNSSSMLQNYLTNKAGRRSSWSAKDAFEGSDGTAILSKRFGTAESSEEGRISQGLLTEEPEDEWIHRYLEREKKEEETWQKKLRSQDRSGALERIASLKLFKQ